MEERLCSPTLSPWPYVPREGEEDNRDDGAGEDCPKGGVPAVMLGDIAQAFSFDDAADIAEEANKASGCANGFFGGEVEGDNAREQDGGINKKADYGEEN